jgi:uncharacterized membrane protein
MIPDQPAGVSTAQLPAQSPAPINDAWRIYQDHFVAPRPALNRLFLFLLVVAAAILRFAALGRQPLWLDEAADAAFSARPFWDCIFAETVHPPLYRVLLHFVVLRFGDSASAERLLPAVFGILAVPLAAILARRFFPDAETTAAALTATSPFLIFYSQENRDYSLFILLALLSTWTFWRFLESGRGLLLYSVVSILLLYTHHLASFVLLAHEIVFWLYGRRRQRDWVWMRLAVVAAFAPWLIWVARHYHPESRLFIGPALLVPSALLRFFVGYGIAASDGLRKTATWRVKFSEEGPLVIAAFLIFGWLLWRGVRRVRSQSFAAFLAALVLIPWATLVILSPWVQLAHERYVAFQAPFVLILAAAGLCSLHGRARILATALLAILIAFSLTAYYAAPGRAFGYRFYYGKENWAAASDFVRQEHADTVILAPGYLYLAFDRYPRGGSREIQMANGSSSAPDLHGAKRVALVVSHDGPAEQRLRSSLDQAYPQVAEAIFSPQNMIRVIVYDTSIPTPGAAQSSPSFQYHN